MHRFLDDMSREELVEVIYCTQDALDQLKLWRATILQQLGMAKRKASSLPNGAIVQIVKLQNRIRQLDQKTTR